MEEGKALQPLHKDQATKIAELISEIYQQGPTWVLVVQDLETGVQKITRGLNEKAAKKKLKAWRKEKVEELLRSTPEARAYGLRVWHENPHWSEGKVWHWAQNNWFTSLEDAEKASEKYFDKTKNPCEIFEIKTRDVPGHFVVA